MLYPTILLFLSFSTGSLIRGVGDSATEPATWEGTIAVHSSSVPRPYNWTRRITLNATSADIAVTWCPTQDRHAEPVTRQWTRTLSDNELVRVDTLISRLDLSTNARIRPGSCWIDLNLTSSLGQSVSLTTLPGSANNTTARQLYALLAGSGDVILPAHSFVCPR